MNPFEAHGQRHARRERKRKVSPAAKKKMGDNATLMRTYRRLWEKHREEMISTAPDPVAFRDVVQKIETAGPGDADLIYYIASEHRGLDDEHRQFLFSVISGACMRIRMEQEQPPFDDPLPGEPDNLFLECKRELRL